MIEKINTLEQDPPLSFPLTPESGQELADTLGSFGFSLWGHGTGVPEPTLFFEKGVLANSSYRGEPDISKMAISLNPYDGKQADTIADPDFMANRWPHAPGLHPNVVLLAIPDADPDNEVYAPQIMKHAIDPGTDAIPPELVVGWYSPKTNNIDLNPAFDLHTDSHEEQLGHIRTRVAEASNQSGPLGLMPFETPSEPSASDVVASLPTAPIDPDDAIW